MNIAPQPDALTQPFWDAVQQGRLVLQHCRQCQQLVHPPLLLCPGCRSATLAWLPVDGAGTVFSRTVVHHAALAAVKADIPYVIALVALDAGPRMVLNVINRAPDEVRIGDRGRVVMHTNDQGITLPQFEVAGPD